MTKEVRVEVRVRNNPLYEAVFKKFRSVSAFCKEHGLHEVVLGRFLNLKEAPWKQSRNDDGTVIWKKEAKEIAAALRRFPEDLFPSDLYQNPEAPKGFAVAMGLEEARLLSAQRSLDPYEVIEEKMKGETVVKALSTLQKREADILKLRFGIGGCGEHTLESTGRIFGVSGARIRDIEKMAIRKLKHPYRARAMRSFDDIEAQKMEDAKALVTGGRS